MGRLLKFNYVIGAGAMGTVYHAELRVPEGGFTRQCAVKIMKATGTEQEHFRTRMRDEARLLGMLHDEQILGVSELVSIEGRDAVIMEYVEGVDLGDLIQVHSVPPRALAELGAELAGTLYRAHAARHPNTGEPLHVIHRDVKPANVMITSLGGVRLLDFGVARAAFDSRESQTQGLVLGTLNYFPPEILAGGDPSPAVDLYGLGLTLWECATGKEWGPPQVAQSRFERRVEQRLSEIAEDYHALIPALQAMLQWDPAVRAHGLTVEQELLQAADRSSGQGLRTWSRKVVRPIIDQRAGRPRPTDELVGREIPIDASHTSTGETLVPKGIAPESLAGRPVVPGPEISDESTYNDMAPPAAVRRGRKSVSTRGRPAVVPANMPPTPPVATSVSVLTVVLLASAVGLAVGLAIVALLVLALLILL